QLVLSLQPSVDKCLVLGRRGLKPLTIALVVPRVHFHGGSDPLRRNIIRTRVELLRVQAVPELAFAVALAQPICVIAAAAHWPLSVIAVSDLVPVPGVAGMI